MLPEHATPDPQGPSTTGASASAVAEARRAEQLARLLQRITTLANESVDSETALAHATRDITETMGWAAGQALAVHDGVAVRPVGSVHLLDDGSAGAAERLADIAGAGSGPIPQVITSRRAVWKGGDHPSGSGGRTEATGWLGFPIVIDGEVTAVLHFVSAQAGSPDPDLLQTMAAVGRQLGVLIERNQVRDVLESLNAELERSNRELERFAYIASHDLQEPLRKIVGFAELLEHRYADQVTGEAAEFLGFVVDGAHRMRQLVQDLLAYSRAGRRKPELGATDLAEVVEAAIGDVQPRIEDVDAKVTVEGPLPVVHGNASELRELVVNLLSNALKYHGDAPAEITVRVTGLPDGWWRLTVADNGIGIDPDHHDRIFDVFQRLHAPGRYDGTGIGLAICRQIAEHHGGRMWVDSTPHVGSQFHVSLPPADETAEATHA